MKTRKFNVIPKITLHIVPGLDFIFFILQYKPLLGIDPPLLYISFFLFILSNFTETERFLIHSIFSRKSYIALISMALFKFRSFSSQNVL